MLLGDGAVPVDSTIWKFLKQLLFQTLQKKNLFITYYHYLITTWAVFRSNKNPKRRIKTCKKYILNSRSPLRTSPLKGIRASVQVLPYQFMPLYLVLQFFFHFIWWLETNQLTFFTLDHRSYFFSALSTKLVSLLKTSYDKLFVHLIRRPSLSWSQQLIYKADKSNDKTVQLTHQTHQMEYSLILYQVINAFTSLSNHSFCSKHNSSDNKTFPDS